MSYFQPQSFRTLLPRQRSSPPFIPISSPTTYRGWQVVFHPLVHLDVEALRQAGYPATILRAN